MVYIALTALMFVTFNASIKVWISFFFNAIVLFSITIYHLFYEKKFSPFLSSYIVFTFLFFLAAPITQINSLEDVTNAKFVNFFPYKENLILYVNILIILFNIIFICSYIQIKKRINPLVNLTKDNSDQKYLPLVILILLVISMFVFMGSYSFIKEEFFNPNWLKSDSTSKSSVLIWKKFLFMIPFSGIILCFKYFKKINKKRSNYINIIFFFFLFIFLLFWFKNPLTEKRNALGPIYLSLLFLFLPKVLNTNLKTLSFLFFSMIIVFPLMAIITHSDATLAEMYKNPLILIEQMKGGGVTNALNTLNYDAFANMMASVDLVYKYGFSFGYQLLGALFFFIPRSFWVSKPVSSGQLVGEHLINNYGFGFSNLSNPLISEGFLNFGILGVFIMAIVLAYLLNIMIKWLHSDDYLKKIMAFYFAMHLLFLLRGDFTNGYAYFIGPLLAIIYLPKIIEKTIIGLIQFSKR
nr:O-antigen polymerase [Polaribacter sp. DS7-9]